MFRRGDTCIIFWSYHVPIVWFKKLLAYMNLDMVVHNFYILVALFGLFGVIKYSLPKLPSHHVYSILYCPKQLQGIKKCIYYIKMKNGKRNV